MRTVDWTTSFEAQRAQALQRPGLASHRRSETAVIVEAVRRSGDAALYRLTHDLDRCTLDSFEINPELIEQAYRETSADIIEALQLAFDQITAFHRPQLRSSWTVEPRPGVKLGREIRPINRVGLYIPGGSAPLVSTVLMLAIPARLAGCQELILCTPPRPDASINPHILAAARLCGVSRVFRVGGAQAIAAMAYGTESVPKVDKIFGPGNSWVTEAKILVAMDPEGAAIDMPAGPSEVMVVGDASADPLFIASDLLSQAEHGADSQVMFVCLDPGLKKQVEAALDQLLISLPRADIAREALEHSLTILVEDRQEALNVINRYAPEHLVLQVKQAESWLPDVANAGSVFCGPWTPEAAGDYTSGTNHVLPTGGWARALSGLSVDSFQRTMSVQTLSAAGLSSLAPAIGTLARLEGLDAHALSVRLRMDALTRGKEPL